MKYGVCCGPEVAAVAADAGMDFFEGTVGGILKPLEPESAFKEVLAKLKAAPLPCPVLNCFVPAQLKITGPAVDTPALKEYVTTVFERSETAGIETIVFGSGGARRAPEGFDHAKAREQLLDFCRMIVPMAAKHGVLMVMEPLFNPECNLINSTEQGAQVVRDVNHPSFFLLVDRYHWRKENDSVESIVDNGSLIRHVHVATRLNRLPPGAEQCDLPPFFKALKMAGYNRRISVEGKIPDPATYLPRAVRIMKELLA